MSVFDFSSFGVVLQWVIAHGYPLMFLAMCLEGPTVTAAATFAVSLGYFDIWVVFALSLLGDIVPDMVYYAVGFFGGGRLAEAIGKKIGVTERRMETIRKKVTRHGGKTVAILKYTPLLAAPGLMLVGAAKMSIARYLFFVAAVTLQKTLLFMAIGYFLGQAYNVGTYIQYGALVPFVLIVGYFSAAFVYKKVSERIAHKFGKF